MGKTICLISPYGIHSVWIIMSLYRCRQPVKTDRLYLGFGFEAKNALRSIRPPEQNMIKSLWNYFCELPAYHLL